MSTRNGVCGGVLRARLPGESHGNAGGQSHHDTGDPERAGKGVGHICHQICRGTIATCFVWFRVIHVVIDVWLMY